MIVCIDMSACLCMGGWADACTGERVCVCPSLFCVFASK